MSSIRSEYQRFLRDLDAREVSDDARRLASVVYEHLDALAEVGATRRARSTRLVPLAVRHLAAAATHRAAEFPVEHEAPPAFRLQQLTVGPFRGFMAQETFDLSHDITLVYGANGTGKSSFCEAVETAMLGTISEAVAKRVDLQQYCNNARLRRHVRPVLTTRTGEAEAAALVADEAEFRFCFIEKNRLDDFARIAARTPGDQRQLIATLFGVDQFNDFVRGFNQSLDESLTLAGPCATQLKARREQLATSYQVIKDFPEKLKAHEAAEAALAERIRPGQTYAAAYAWLLGAGEAIGRLAAIQTIIDEDGPTIQDVTRERLQYLLAEKQRNQELASEATLKLSARAQEVSYAQLYQAVAALAEGATTCPACGTDLAHVHANPFDRAAKGLKELEELAVLQQELRDLQDAHSQASMTLRTEMARTISAARAVAPKALEEAALPPLPEKLPDDWFAEGANGVPSPWTRLVTVAGEVEDKDTKGRLKIADRVAHIEERKTLEPLRLEVEALRTRKDTLQGEFGAAQAVIAAFDEANSELIKQAFEEEPVLRLHFRIKTAYDAFLPALERYLEALPAKLLQGLNEQAKALYNAFNRGDPPGDLLHALSLPQAENEKIEVVFAGEQNRRYDALVILSEGHIRCLGLAILLAKNIAQRCPAVIFDDVVNAIDDDHRSGIWRTFFEDGHLDGKQVILTSHAQEFLDRIQQELGAARAGQIKRFKFLPHAGEHELNVDGDPPTKNYVLRAQEALAQDERRDALRHSRPAIEALTDQLWRWFGNRVDGRLELKLAGPGMPWELNNKCVKLRAAVGRITEQFPAAAPAVQALTALTGVAGNSIEWGYLNSGTHDAVRGHEFDGATVRNIVEAVGALDAAVTALRNPARR
ncbi:AAA family ATPase [Roseateles sp. LYH14W]|uniref:AAA family ATPase n=1 Tax=Pelomonas parva TaxID=3299032 RepID=A0ABW7FAA5_9BURK